MRSGTPNTSAQSSLIGGRYEIISRLGKGGMGEVYRVQDTRLLRHVAMKILTNASDSEGALFYFHREARAVAALRHPGIVQIFDYSGPDERPPYIVMDLVEGGDLIAMLEKRFPLPEFAAMGLVYGIAGALAHAHEHGVVHRDIKPANVLLEPSGRILLSDFGLAKAYRDPEQLGKTLADRATRLLGTADFLAPEQITDEESSPDSDVFALGSLTYWLCSGVSPFNDNDPVMCMRKVVEGNCIPLKHLRPELSPEVLALVSDCHRSEPYLRPSSAEVRDRCRAWFASRRFPNATEELEAFLNDQVREHTSITRRVSAPDADEPTQVSGTEDTAIVTAITLKVLTELRDSGELDRPTATKPASAPKPSLPPTVRVEPSETPVRARKPGGARWRWALLPLLLAVPAGWWVVRTYEEPVPLAPSVEDVPAPATPSPKPAPAPPSVVEPEEPAPAPQPPPADEGVRSATPRRTEGRRSNERNAEPASKGPQVVKVVVDPWGEIYLDGEYQGNTPKLQELEAPAGNHEITAVHPTLGEIKKTVRFGQQRRLKITFPR